MTNLISEVSLQQNQIGLRLEPAGNHGAVPVALGSSEFEQKLEELDAYWYQFMVSRQDITFESLDLRFRGQIVAR